LAPYAATAVMMTASTPIDLAIETGNAITPYHL
jgi:hypothetical protein